MSDIKCPICKSNATDNSPNGMDGQIITCTRCGYFSISMSASASWNVIKRNNRQIANASGWIREHQGISISSDDIEFLSSVKTPPVAERADRVLQAIAKESTNLSYSFTFSSNIPDKWLGISYSENSSELNYLFQTYLKYELGHLSLDSKMMVDFFLLEHICITPKGYAYLDSLSSSATASQIGFCAMWFDKSVLPIWANAIEPAIKGAGYDPKRIDSHQHNNRIDDEIIAMLRRSKFVVADFTGQRGGVYFESGFALGLGLQVIWTCKKSELDENKIHFDTRQYNFITWEENKLGEFKVALQNRIEATIGRGNFS
jgi:nucleoside 2-deoxyribosyltransferase